MELSILLRKWWRLEERKYIHWCICSTLALILLVATAIVEKVFSAMNIVKNRLRNQMGDEWMNDSLVVYIEREIFYGIDNDTIMEGFQKMKTRQDQL
ncbi:hypothetical protein ACSBR2_011865 [Camellia fascicularis]